MSKHYVINIFVDEYILKYDANKLKVTRDKLLLV